MNESHFIYNNITWRSARGMRKINKLLFCIFRLEMTRVTMRYGWLRQLSIDNSF